MLRILSNDNQRCAVVTSTLVTQALLVVCGFVGSLAWSPSSCYADTPPNIVFFFADDQTISTLGCYGNDVVQTPNIDTLAAQGTRFENMFVSHSICWVSRTSILTGLTGRTFGTPGQRDLARPEAVAELYSDYLRKAGYRTGYFGKWHAKTPPGFKAQEHFDKMEVIGRNPYYKKMPDGSLRHETEVIVDRGIDFIKSQPKDKPFALNMWFNACHAEDGDRRPGIGMFPWPKSSDGMYDDVTIGPPALNAPEVFDALPEFLKNSINRERYFWRWNTPEKYQTNIHAYYRMVSGIDHQIGRFREALKEAGLDKNTIIVYSADNGYYLGNRGLAGKWSHFEESLRVPLIVMDPRVNDSEKHKVVSDIALNIDLPASFLDWAGIEVPVRYQGRSLKPIVSGKTPADWRVDSFHEHFAVRNRIPAFEGIRNENFKYVRYVDHHHEFLHDLKNDPNELVNLVGDPKYQDVLRQMRTRTDQRVAELGGPLLPLQGPFVASTQPHPVASALVGMRPGADGFVRLFDGKSLRNWTGDTSLWSVKDGAITGKTDGNIKMNEFLSWKQTTIRNFELRMQVKINAGGNSGIQYRSAPRPEIGLDVVSGYQCDIVGNNPSYNGMLYEERGRGILCHSGEEVIIDPDGQPWVVKAWDVPKLDATQWHQYRIVAKGNHLRHFIDDNMISDVTDCNAKARALDGVLALQVHKGKDMTVQFKDIRMKIFPDDLPLVDFDSVEIPDDALQIMPQGRKAKGFKPARYGDLKADPAKAKS